jgi:hypothetical protein
MNTTGKNLVAPTEAEIRAIYRRLVAEEGLTRDEQIGRRLFPAQYGSVAKGDEAIPVRKTK